VLRLASAALKVFIALGPCEMRKSFNGLDALTSGHLNAVPARDALLVFNNRRHNRKRPEIIPRRWWAQGGAIRQATCSVVAWRKSR
jgi:hypothetical protein